MDTNNYIHNTNYRNTKGHKRMGRSNHNMADNKVSNGSQKSVKNGNLAEYSRYSY